MSIRVNVRVLGPAVIASFCLTLGCDTRAPGGSPLPQGPTSSLGKARQSAKDMGKKISEGGNDREAVMLNANIKIDQATETLASLEAMPGESVRKAVRVARDKVALVKSAIKSLEEAVGDEQPAKDKVRKAVAEMDEAVTKAKDAASGG